MKAKNILTAVSVLVVAAAFCARGCAGQTADPSGDDSDVRPPVTTSDLKLVKRSRRILYSPSKWNRVDTRECPCGAKTFSLYCALKKATEEAGGNFEHRSAAMQEARFVIDEIAPKNHYEHRLMGYNNDPSTRFSDIQRVLKLLEIRILRRLSRDPDRMMQTKPGR